MNNSMQSPVLDQLRDVVAKAVCDLRWPTATATEEVSSVLDRYAIFTVSPPLASSAVEVDLLQAGHLVHRLSPTWADPQRLQVRW